MTNNNPVGFFDSGVGGISIWMEFHNLLPNESSIYLADSKNAPYGQKTKNEIIALSKKNTEFLLRQNCKLIVVACNTATTNAIAELRDEYDISFIGIEPAIKPAALGSQTHTIGVLATKGTLSSELFSKAVETYSNTKIIEQVGFDLVRLIEQGQMHSERMSELLYSYMEPMIRENVDYLVLGCTHYPFLIPQIKKLLPDHVRIIDSGEAVAKRTYRILESVGFSDNPKPINSFYTNGNPDVLQQLIGDSFKAEIRDF
ncbi:glutamate racemase [Flavobacterium silvaticum]|uniref:Glutamate racemase n=1 Tax=Flavobacterium silvaticum TaxID=1852020 RepID=A0A972FZ25_9FLAO|nr:glutamate racemase [Flavobacterium silvaticum]NMH27441.1 glutamate racemase [Flavobacterium silvaticum]